MMDNQVQIRRRPVIRVFVSSTFTDLKHERDALQQDVFPKLEQLGASRQFQFQAIDLRWGVPTEASLDHRTMRICFEELRRSQEISPQPNFLILLGNRYGWRPLPEEISVKEFEELQKAATTDATVDADAENIREIRAIRGQNLDPISVVRAWYRRDENAVPPVYLLQSRKQNLNDGRDYTNDQVWNEAQRVLWCVINRAYPAAQMAGRFDHLAVPDEPLPSIVRFQASATEQEIWRGALGASKARQHVLAFVREIDYIEESQPVEIRDFVDVDESGAINAVSQGALRELKQELHERLGESNVIGIEHARLIPTTNEKGQPSAGVTTGHLDELCARVHTALKDIITRQMDEYWGTSDPTVASPRELELERSEHQRFGQERAPANSFVGRERHLQAIKAYLHNNSNQPLVIHGASGCGKTALLAKAVQEIQKSEVSGQRPEVIVRFIGVTPRSSDVRSLLASLCQELRRRDPLERPIPGDVRELTNELDEHFKTATAQAPLILFLDALDQLADTENGPSLFWIPFGQLPAHVKLLVSCLSDTAPEDPASQPYATLKRRGLAEENFINLNALSEDDAQKLLFERWLPQARRKLNAEQAERIREQLKSDACRQPLYLKVLFEEARLWRSDDRAPTLGNDVPELLGTLFNRLGDLSNHGPTLECALSYIAAARRGLTEVEILEVLYRDPDYTKFLKEMTARTGHQLPDNPKRIPIAIWSRLRFDLAPYLTERAAPSSTVLNFYHRQVDEFVRGQFLDTPLKRQQRHERLAGYFHGLDYFLESLEEQRARTTRLPPTPRPANVRKVDELPWQQLEEAKLSGKWDAAEKLFTDLFFVEAKAEAGMVFELAGDSAEAINSTPAERPKHRILKLLDEALRRDIHFVARHPTTLFQCLWNLCWWYDCPQAALHYNEPTEANLLPRRAPKDRLCSLLERWRKAKHRVSPSFVWARALRPPAIPLDSTLRAVLRGHKGPVTCVDWSPDGRTVASGSADQSLCLWNSSSGELLNVLSGHTDWLWAVVFSPDGRRLATAAADQTVRIWDTTTGAVIHVCRGHKGFVRAVSWSPDGKVIVTGSEDKTFRVWDAESGKLIFASSSQQGFVDSVCFSQDGMQILTGDSAGTIRVWSASGKTELLTISAFQSGQRVRAVMFSPDRRCIVASASGRQVADVRVLDSTTGNLLWGCDEIRERTGRIAVARDGRVIAVSCGNEVGLRKLHALAEISVLRAHEDSVSDVAFSPNGQLLASSSFDHTVRIWSSTASATLPVLRGHRFEISAMARSDDGRRLATADHMGSVIVWDAKSGKPIHILHSNCRGIDRIQFAADSKGIQFTGRSCPEFAWDLASGEPVELPRQSSRYRSKGCVLSSGVIVCRLVPGLPEITFLSRAADLPLVAFPVSSNYHPGVFEKEGWTLSVSYPIALLDNRYWAIREEGSCLLKMVFLEGMRARQWRSKRTNSC